MDNHQHLEALKKISETLSKLGADYEKNINDLTALCGNLLRGTCALYNRLENGMLCSIGRWNTPPDYNPIDKPDGRICYDLIQKNSPDVIVIRNLPGTQYAQSDPNVAAYGLLTYIGKLIFSDEKCLGSLCVVYQNDYSPTQDDIYIFNLIVSSIQRQEQRKKMEISLQESEAHLRESQELGHIGSWEFDIEKQTIVWSKETYILYERDPRIGPPSSDEEERYYSPVQAKILRDYAAQSIATGKQSSCDLKVKLPSGKTAWFFAVMHPHKNRHGQVVKLSGTVQDITERKKMELSLRESEAQYRTLIETTDTGYVIIDEEGKVIDANAEYVRLAGHKDLNEIRGRSVIEWTADYEIGKNALAVGKCFKDGFIKNLEIDYADKQGKITSVEINATVIERKGIKQILTLCRDITERKQVSRNLLYFQKAVEDASDAIGLSTSEGKHYYQNKAFTELFGLSVNEVAGEAGPPSTVFVDEKVGRAIFETIKGGYSWIGEVEMLDKERHKIDVFLRAYPIKDEKNNVVGLVGVHTDISERKKMEKEKENLQKKLLRAEKMSALGQLASGVAHELNNPLSIILGYSQSLLEQVAKEHSFFEPLTSVEKETQRCKDLVQNLLSFSRIGSVEKELTDLKKLIENSLSLIATQAKMSIAKIEKKFEEGLPEIPINRGQIQQIMINLCSNALDSMKKNGTLTVGILKDKKSDKYIEVYVKDTGCGIPKEQISRIFEPFFTTKEVGKGTGLGLALVYEIVQKHNGQISVESEVGKGSTFTILLPISGSGGK